MQRKASRKEKRDKTTMRHMENNEMATEILLLSIITLNVNILNSPPNTAAKRTKNRIQLHVLYKKLTLELRTHIG